MAVISLSDAFNDCVDRLFAGQSLDDCLRAYPQYAAALRPLLETGMAVQRAQPVVPSGARARARGRVMQAAAQMERPPRRFPVWQLRALAVASVLVVIIMVGAFILNRQNDSADNIHTVPLPSASPTETLTPTPTATLTPTPTLTPTNTPTSTITASPTATMTAPPTATRRPSFTPTLTATATPSPTRSPSPTVYVPSPLPTSIPTTIVPPVVVPTDDHGGGDDGGSDDNSGPGGGDDGSDDNSGPGGGDDNSGSGGGGDDNSGSGSDNSGSDDNSGSGGDDNSGHGGDDKEDKDDD